ncbi:MAG: type IV toxin-antitoxin system AbiEi family antitoxin [Anaerolineales bacterium]
MSNKKDRNSSQKRRTISDTLAPIVEHLELKGDRIVLLNDLRNLRPGIPDATVRWTVHELVERGWLEPLAVKGAYEFIPGSAAGAYQSGDPWLNLKAALRLQPKLKAHVGLASAAWIHGYRERVPARHTIVAARVPKPPPSLSSVYIIIKTNQGKVFGAEQKRGLPVATIERIFVEVAWRPDLVEIRSDIEWLWRLGADLDAHAIPAYLGRLSIKSVWARAGYLAELIRQAELANLIEELMPKSKGPFYLGNATRADRYVSRWKLYDNLGLWELTPEARTNGF